MRFRMLLVSMSAAIAVLPVALAHATITHVGGYTYVSRGIHVAAGKALRTKIACPENTYAYGGGQSNDGDFGAFEQRQSYPIDDKDHGSKPEDGWGLLVKNRSSAEAKVRLYAICGPVKATYQTKKYGASASGSELDAPLCSSTKSLVGGGLAAPAPVSEEDGAPIPHTGNGEYYAYAKNLSGSRKVTMHSICAPLDVTYVASSSGPTATAGTQQYRTVTCPPSTFVLSGGMSSTGGVRLNSGFPASSSGWSIYGDVIGTFMPSISSAAACAPQAN